MKNADFYGLVYMEYPDDYSEMSEEEISRYFRGNALRWGVRCPEKHIMLSLGKTGNSIFNVFYDAKGALNGAEKVLAKNLKDYKRRDEFDAVVLGNNAKGIHFEYTADDVDVRQFCELVVAKVKRCFYTVYCISRAKDAATSAPLFEEFRGTLRLL